MREERGLEPLHPPQEQAQQETSCCTLKMSQAPWGKHSKGASSIDAGHPSCMYVIAFTELDEEKNPFNLIPALSDRAR